MMMKISQLILDYNFYPRNKVPEFNIAKYASAMTAGAKFPPVVVDKKSLRVVDGFTRIHAVQKTHDEDAEIEVILRTYKNENEMFLDCVRLNATHGETLNSWDIARCIVKAKEFSIPENLFREACCITPEVYERMCKEKIARMRAGSGTINVPIKRTIEHVADTLISRNAVEVNDKLGGMRPTFYVNQIIRLIEADLLDWENESLVAALKRLHELLDGAMRDK